MISIRSSLKIGDELSKGIHNVDSFDFEIGYLFELSPFTDVTVHSLIAIPAWVFVVNSLGMTTNWFGVNSIVTPSRFPYGLPETIDNSSKSILISVTKLFFSILKIDSFRVNLS